MPQLKLQIGYHHDSHLVISPTELLEQHFWGIPTCDQFGNPIPHKLIKQKILDAQHEVENYFSIKLFPQIVSETTSYYSEEFTNGYPFVQASYNVRTPYKLEGWYNNTAQMSISKEWLSTRKENNSLDDSDAAMFRNIYIVPGGGSMYNQQPGIVHTGAFPLVAYGRSNYIPNYWKVTYLTGFKKMPGDLIALVAKMASIPVFAQLGDTHLGVGVSNQSISLDGLSQTINSVRNANASIYNARITQYLKELEVDLVNLNRKYKGLLFSVL